MGRCIVAGGKPDMAAPVPGILLSSIAEGSIVKLNENGIPVEFYVAKHDYENTLNGEGIILLARKAYYGQIQWNTSNVNAYENSYIDSFLNSTYKELFDEKTKSAICNTKFYYTPGNGNTTISTLQRCIFLASATELNITSGAINQEGTAFPLADTLRSSRQWSRTPVNNNTITAVCPGTGGFAHMEVVAASMIRPLLALPDTAYFDAVTMILRGVA